MRVSIIIPAINEANCIGRALTCARQAGADELLVVDGGSADDTCAVAQAAGGTVLHSEPGRGPQQNRGARAATGDILLFQHADSWLASQAVAQLRVALADPHIISGAFQQRIDARGLAYRALEKGNAWRVQLRGLAYGDQGIFMRRASFWELGGFPEEPLMEDLILMRAARQLGRPVLLPGPIYVDPRRWQRYGIVRQTLRNWSLLAGYHLGISPKRLTTRYHRHDAE